MIDISNMSFSYDRKKYLFQNMNLQIESGTVCGVLGLNGAGKSTLIKLIHGLLIPDRGTITVDGRDVFPRTVTVMSRMYMLQENMNLPTVSVTMFEKLYAPFYPDFSREVFYEILHKFEVDKEKKIKNLSMGQQKKCHLAFALATQCDILFLDEPTNGLDIPSKSVFRTFISQYTTPEQIILISTHQVRDLGQLLDRLIIIDNGRIVINDSMYELSRKYKTEHVRSDDHSSNIIYRQAGALGDDVVMRKMTYDEPGSLDIELFFASQVQKLSESSKTDHI